MAIEPVGLGWAKKRSKPWAKKGRLSGSSLNAAQALCIDTEALFITRAPDLSRASEGTLKSHFYGGQKVKLIIRHHLRSTDFIEHSKVAGLACISCIPRLTRFALGPSLGPHALASARFVASALPIPPQNFDCKRTGPRGTLPDSRSW